MSGFVNIELMVFPQLLFFFFFSPEMICKSGCCNHLGEDRGTEGEMLSECSLTMITVSKVSFCPVLHCTCGTEHLEPPDLQQNLLQALRPKEQLCSSGSLCCWEEPKPAILLLRLWLS